MSFETLENEVIAILKENHIARADDMALYANYVFTKVKDKSLGIAWLVTVFSDRRFRITNGIAPYSTISRVRRKIQEKYPELKPSPEIVAERKKSEAEYKAYAKARKR